MSIGLCGRHGCQIVDGLCEKCQLEATEFMRPHDELATLRASLERAEAELANRGRCGAFLAMGGEQCVRENDHAGLHYFENEYAPSNEALLLRGEMKAAQSTIADLNGQVERQIGALRTAVLALAHANTEMAPGLYDKAYNAVSDELARAALGGEKPTAPAFTLPPETPPPE